MHYLKWCLTITTKRNFLRNLTIKSSLRALVSIMIGTIVSFKDFFSLNIFNNLVWELGIPGNNSSSFLHCMTFTPKCWNFVKHCIHAQRHITWNIGKLFGNNNLFIGCCSLVVKFYDVGNHREIRNGTSSIFYIQMWKVVSFICNTYSYSATFTVTPC